MNRFFGMALTFCIASGVHAADLDKLNKQTCDILRVERRTQIYEAVGIHEIDSLSKKFLDSASSIEMNELKKAASVAPYDPFWPSEETKRADMLAKEKFAQISSLMMYKMGSRIGGKDFRRADGREENGTPFIRMTSQGPLYRETMIATKPRVSVARVFSNPKQLNLDYLNQYSNLIFVVTQPLYGETLAGPSVEIIGGDSSFTLSSLVEETMPENCKATSTNYDRAFDSIEKNVTAVNDSSKNELKQNSEQSPQSVQSGNGTVK